jgi:hypothetical protein
VKNKGRILSNIKERRGKITKILNDLKKRRGKIRHRKTKERKGRKKGMNKVRVYGKRRQMVKQRTFELNSAYAEEEK